MWALNFLAYDGFVKVNRAVMGTQEHEETSLLQCATAGAMAAVPTTVCEQHRAFGRTLHSTPWLNATTLPHYHS